MAPPKVFISYAHEDRAWCERFQQHLGGLKHQGRLAVWADDQIMAGAEWDPAIRKELDEAAIIVLIVTPAFLGSAFCQTVELKRAMERHGDGGARVIPIIAEHCYWNSLPISELQARPQDEKRNLLPLRAWPDPNVPLTAIVREIHRLIGPAEPGAAAESPEPAAGRTHLLHRRRTFFIGRDREKQQLKERLAGGGRATICAVAGMGGVGKTELALQVAGDLGERTFSDGIVTVDLLGIPDPTAAATAPQSPVAAMRQVLVHFDPTTKPLEEADALAGAYRRALVGKNLLLILDNARDATQVTPLLPPEPVALLVTSRTHIALPEGLILDLDTLDPGDALALLKEEIGAARLLDDATLARFAELCGYLPVALLAIAGTIKTSQARGPQQLLTRLEADRSKGLTGVLDRLRPSVEALAEDDPDLARRFARLAVFAGDFAIEAAAYVWDVDEDITCDGIDELLKRSLLLPAANDSPELRFRLHDLIREIAADRLGDDADAAALLHATFYRDLLARCQDLYLSGYDSVLKSLDLFDRERAEITAGQRWAMLQADNENTAAPLAADYPDAGIDVIELRLDCRTRIVWLEVAIVASRRLGDRAREGAALGNLGLAWAELGEMRKAIEFHEKNLVIMREIGGRRGECYALGNLGIAWKNLGEPLKAMGYYEQSLVIAREIGDRRGEGNALGNLGNACEYLGVSRKAIEYQEETLVIAREIGDRRREGNALGNLGLAWAALGEAREAIGFYEQNLVIMREIGDRRGEGNALRNMADAYEQLGDREAALAKAKAGFVIFRAIEHPYLPQGAAWLRERGVDPDSL